MADLHRRDDALDDQGGSESRSQSQKEHFTSSVAAQGLHRGVVDELHRTAEAPREVEADPAAPEVARLRYWPPAQDRPGVTN
jgi:hypothetical protein